jgi:hypothetical protein
MISAIQSLYPLDSSSTLSAAGNQKCQKSPGQQKMSPVVKMVHMSMSESKKAEIYWLKDNGSSHPHGNIII